MRDHIRPALTMLLILTILTGFVYPLTVTGLAQLFFPDQANGSLDHVESFNGWIIDASGEDSPHIYLYLEYRWSINGSNWSLWTDLTQPSISSIIVSPDNPLWVEVRMTAMSDENASPYYPSGTPLSPPIILLDFELDFGYRTVDPRVLMGNPPAPLCSKELTNYPIVFSEGNFTFKPYDINRSINLYQDLSRVVNNVFGHEVVYYSVQPQGRGKDVVLKEYNLFNVVDAPSTREPWRTSIRTYPHGTNSSWMLPSCLGLKPTTRYSSIWRRVSILSMD